MTLAAEIQVDDSQVLMASEMTLLGLQIMTETVFNYHRRNETGFHSQKNQCTAEGEKLFDDTAIQNFKG